MTPKRDDGHGEARSSNLSQTQEQARVKPHIKALTEKNMANGGFFDWRGEPVPC